MLRSSEQLQAYLCIPVMTETMHTIFNAVCTVTDQLLLSKSLFFIALE
jgi:hypothetical protein